MKLLIVTAVAQFRDQVHELFKKANIESFSGSGIDGYKSSPALLKTSSWFRGEVGGVESHLFFAFTSEEKVSRLLQMLTDFNKDLETDNPLKMVVLPVEKYV